MAATVLCMLIFFPLGVRLADYLLPKVPRAVVLAVASLLGLTCFSYSFYLHLFGSPAAALHRAAVTLLLYLGVVLVQGRLLRHWAPRGGWRTLAAFLLPLVVLVVVKYLPLPDFVIRRIGAGSGIGPDLLIGISYMAFRLSYLTLEVRNGTVAAPRPAEFLAFAFFLPTLSVGPINTYATHSGRGTDRTPLPGAWLRMLLGAVKFSFLASMVNQFSYTGLLLDGHPHAWVDLPTAMVCYYLFLYLNFSGYCDMAIGVAGLLGIRVAENFENPFAARNVKDFWNRWHITLSTYMRDVVFSPLSKWLVRTLGPARVNHATAICIMVVFLLVGIWHGVGWHFLLFGLSHGLAVAANHYYTIFLKKTLGRARFLAYGKSALVRGTAVVLTFAYISASLFLFANDGRAMRAIFTVLH